MAKTKLEGRLKRKQRVRKKIFGTTERPRLTVYRSLKHIYAQIIDDEQGKTLVFASTLQKEQAQKGKNKEVAKLLGNLVAEKAKQANVKQVVFDRNGYIYHGCLQALADAVREGGVKF